MYWEFNWHFQYFGVLKGKKVLKQSAMELPMQIYQSKISTSRKVFQRSWKPFQNSPTLTRYQPITFHILGNCGCGLHLLNESRVRFHNNQKTTLWSSCAPVSVVNGQSISQFHRYYRSKGYPMSQWFSLRAHTRDDESMRTTRTVSRVKQKCP